MPANSIFFFFVFLSIINKCTSAKQEDPRIRRLTAFPQTCICTVCICSFTIWQMMRIAVLIVLMVNTAESVIALSMFSHVQANRVLTDLLKWIISQNGSVTVGGCHALQIWNSCTHCNETLQGNCHCHHVCRMSAYLQFSVLHSSCLMCFYPSRMQDSEHETLLSAAPLTLMHMMSLHPPSPHNQSWFFSAHHRKAPAVTQQQKVWYSSM